MTWMFKISGSDYATRAELPRGKGIRRRVSVDCRASSDHDRGHSSCPLQPSFTETKTEDRRRTRAAWGRLYRLYIGGLRSHMGLRTKYLSNGQNIWLIR